MKETVFLNGRGAERKISPDGDGTLPSGRESAAPPSTILTSKMKYCQLCLER